MLNKRRGAMLLLTLLISTSKPPQLRNEFLDRFIVIPEHRLLFCYIEKVGCTRFNEMFYTLTDRKTKRFWYSNAPSQHNMTKSDLENLLADNAWHKAVFYREPLERFLSAFRSKCEDGHDRDGKGHCIRAFGQPRPTFPEAVSALMSPLNKGDAHWTPQYRFCGGLDRTLQYYDTVQNLQKPTASSDVQRLLTAVGVPSSGLAVGLEFFPPTNKSRYIASRHQTNALNALSRYYTDDHMIRTVATFYASDYVLFGIPPPAWALPALFGTT